MNFLAHLHLSGDNEKLRIGNFIADFVRGNRYDMYDAEVQKGIIIHRHIDHFTDNHPVVSESKQRLYENYHKYAAVIIDIYYDHFLAANWALYSKIDLQVFAEGVYADLAKNEAWLPEEVRQFYPYMQRDNWLVKYGQLYGIQMSLEGMARRAKFKSNMEFAVEDLKEHYPLFEAEFKIYYPELIAYVKTLI